MIQSNLGGSGGGRLPAMPHITSATVTMVVDAFSRRKKQGAMSRRRASASVLLSSNCSSLASVTCRPDVIYSAILITRHSGPGIMILVMALDSMIQQGLVQMIPYFK
jgi:hypothetical protein